MPLPGSPAFLRVPSHALARCRRRRKKQQKKQERELLQVSRSIRAGWRRRKAEEVERGRDGCCRCYTSRCSFPIAPPALLAPVVVRPTMPGREKKARRRRARVPRWWGDISPRTTPHTERVYACTAAAPTGYIELGQGLRYVQFT